VDEEEPVAAPRDVADHPADAGDVERHVRAVPVGRDVGDLHRVRVEERGDHRSDRRVHAVGAERDAAQVVQGHEQTDRAVAAHAEAADVVEEEDAGRRVRVVGRQQERTDHRRMAAGFAHHRVAPIGACGVEPCAPLGERARAQVGAAGHDQPGGFAAGVAVDDTDVAQVARHPTRSSCRRANTRAPWARRPSCSNSLVTHRRRFGTRAAVSWLNASGT
jgi:hypothetical protein